VKDARDDALEAGTYNAAAIAASSARRRAALLATAASVLALVAVGTAASGITWLPALEVAYERGTGWAAFGALLLSLLVTPLGRIAARLGRVPQLVLQPAMRRALGMAAAWLALSHAFASLKGSLAWNWAALGSWPHLRAGLTALGILLVLLVTSFGAVVARSRLRFWRELHRLAYLVPLLVLQHVLLSPFAPRALALWLVGVVYAVGLARYVPLHRRPPDADANPKHSV
jgi:DMSO/TMAO reductase YedYZ heme-binding membrane subunit